MPRTDHFSYPHKWGTLRPQFIISLVGLLTLLGIIGGYIEITQSRRDVMELLRREAKAVSSGTGGQQSLRRCFKNHTENRMNFVRRLRHLV